MPIYEYTCRACGHRFELLVRRETVEQCSACRSDDIERLLSLPAVKSSSTEAQALRAARQRDAKLGAERTQAQRQYEQSHND
jgi:putative FmdB family regulatory protein